MVLSYDQQLPTEFGTPLEGQLDQWYAIVVKPKHEKTVSVLLRRKGYEEFLPLYRVKRRWKTKCRDVVLPLFPRYTFCRFDFVDRIPILATPGVRRVVRCGPQPTPVDPQEIRALQLVVQSGLPFSPHPFLRTGVWVEIKAGPLAGVRGVLKRFKDSGRLILSVSLLQRSLSVEVDPDCVLPIPPFSAF